MPAGTFFRRIGLNRSKAGLPARTEPLLIPSRKLRANDRFVIVAFILERCVTTA